MINSILFSYWVYLVETERLRKWLSITDITFLLLFVYINLTKFPMGSCLTATILYVPKLQNVCTCTTLKVNDNILNEIKQFIQNCDNGYKKELNKIVFT